MSTWSNNALKRRLRGLVTRGRANPGNPTAERVVDEMMSRGMFATIATILGGHVNG